MTASAEPKESAEAGQNSSLIAADATVLQPREHPEKAVGLSLRLPAPHHMLGVVLVQHGQAGEIPRQILGHDPAIHKHDIVLATAQPLRDQFRHEAAAVTLYA